MGEIPNEGCFLFKDAVKLKSNPSRAATCKLGRKGKKRSHKDTSQGGLTKQRNWKKRKGGLHVACKLVNKFC